MEGRDTGSEGHARAVRYVVERFEKAGLRPAGEAGQWTQTIPFAEVRLEKEGTTFEVVRPDGRHVPLRFLHDVSVRATSALPKTVRAPLSFRGYCSPNEVGNVRGRVVVCFGGRRANVPSAAERLEAAARAGAAAIVNVDDSGFTMEPARWPDAYARSVTPRGTPAPAHAALPVIRLRSEVLAQVIEGAGQDAAAILEAGASSRPLPSFDVPAAFHATFATTERTFSSDNVLARLPGTDPVVGAETVIVSAHIDGYGVGEPVDGDALYNGAFDDAAYVATLVRLAEQRQGRGFRRSVLFAVYTGEEKGLHGSTWFASHLTIPRADIAAVINLDQLRPLFPLRFLTMHAIEDSTLATNAKRVAADMGIELRPDLEPERNLNRRTDHFPFLRLGIPATNFVFAFDPGTEAERRYREWYRVRYHRPQDDMTQPLDWDAARDMNRFFYQLVEDVANDATRPAMLPDSPWRAQ